MIFRILTERIEIFLRVLKTETLQHRYILLQSLVYVLLVTFSVLRVLRSMCHVQDLSAQQLYGHITS